MEYMSDWLPGKFHIIGDIHGCSGALNALLEKLRPDPGTDTLILLGDLFDRGPDSWEVLQTVKALARDFGERFALLRGNHEDYLLQPRLSFHQRMVWDRVGRQATVASFKRHREKMESSVPWLQEHCRMYFKAPAFQCVHAGLLVDPIEANDAHTLLNDHEIVLRNRSSGPLTITGHIALDEPTWFAGDGENYEKIPYGKWLELPSQGILCIDTGCGKGGRLTAMTVENSAFLLTGQAEA